MSSQTDAGYLRKRDASNSINKAATEATAATGQNQLKAVSRTIVQSVCPADTKIPPGFMRQSR